MAEIRRNMKNYSMYIDDIREPHNEFDIIVRSSQQAIQTMQEYGCPLFISFDHDLGGDDTSMIIVKFMIDTDLNEGSFIPEDFKWNIHSANPIGSANINGMMRSYMKHKFDYRIFNYAD